MTIFQFTENSSQAENQPNDVVQAKNQPNDVVDSHEETALAASSSQLNPYNFEVGSVIQYGKPPQCGVIKWIGNLPGHIEMFAGVEMVRRCVGISYR